MLEIGFGLLFRSQLYDLKITFEQWLAPGSFVTYVRPIGLGWGWEKDWICANARWAVGTRARVGGQRCRSPFPPPPRPAPPRSPQPGAQGPPGQPGHGGVPPLLDRCWSKWRPPQANMHSHCSPISILPHNCIPYSRNIFASLIPAINLQSLLAQYICIPYSRNIVALPFLAIYLHSLFS